MTGCRTLLALALLLLLLSTVARSQPVDSTKRLLPGRTTVLMAAEARRSSDLIEFQPGSHGRFHVSGWSNASQVATWTVERPEAGPCEVHAVVRCRAGGPLRIEVVAGDAVVTGRVVDSHWQRVRLDGTLPVPAGRADLVLRLASARPDDTFLADVLSVELAPPGTAAAEASEAATQRADTAWMRRAGYGFMVHWTSQSQPRSGAAKSYADAVRDFDVELFAAQMQAGGAGFVVFTTSHAFQYFPAPLPALDSMLPGRTAGRDLIADLARALRARGLRLFLYYHPGASHDPEWMAASGLADPDPSRFFANWTRIVAEIGGRYGDALAGWWFDDGAIVYYPRSPDWRALAAAARVGNPQRAIGFNPWEYPSVGPYQDFYCGEGNVQPDSDGTLKQDGCGLLGPGRYPGLQACATLVTEGDWGHFVRDREIGPPRWKADQLRSLLDAFARHGNVPIFNLEIYQDGRVSPATLDLFRQMRKDVIP